MIYKSLKRVMDIILSAIGLLILSPLLGILFLLIYVKMGRPVFFKQKRPGINGKPFYMFKFRTMLELYDENGHLLSDELRLSSFGIFLRSTSLDEIPELINVFKGEMSLVGPRPLLMEYLERYDARQLKRHDVKPGITGWAQINGRNSLSWEDKFELDIWYVENKTIGLDIKILFKTILKVVKREGISAVGEATMGEFCGSSNISSDS